MTKHTGSQNVCTTGFTNLLGRRIVIRTEQYAHEWGLVSGQNNLFST